MRDTCIELVAGLIRNPEQLADVMELAKPDDVPFPDLSQIMAQVCGLIADGITPTPAILLDRIPDQPAAGYEASVIDCFEAVGAQPVEYAKIVNRENRKAQASELANNVQRAVLSGDFDGNLQNTLAEFSDLTRPASKPLLVASELPSWRQRLTQPRQGVKTGYEALDRRLFVLGSGELSIVAARPGMGKTAMMLDIAKRQQSGIVFTLEMSADELISRGMSALAKVNSKSFRTRNFTHDELQRIDSVSWNTGLQIVDNPMVTVEEIDAIVARERPEFVAIDYLQLMVSKGENRNQEVGHLSRSLKRMAKKHNCHVMALSQLNRGVESRVNKRPTQADLRESGELEQDADQIILLYRHGVYDKNFPHYMVTEVNLAKFRQGEPGTEFLEFHGEHTTFKDASDFAIDQYKGALNHGPKEFKPRAASM